MARARNIKPAFFKNEELGIVSREARLLFIGLWTLADRCGRLEDRPARIAAEVFPYDRDITIGQVDQWLQALADSSETFIIRYKASDSKSYIQVSNFAKHQSPHVKEQASTIPAPDMPGASPVQAPDMPEKGSVLHPLNPDSLNPSSLNVDVTKPGVATHSPIGIVPKKPALDFDAEAAFEKLYARHPQAQRRDRGLARTYYAQSVMNGADPAEIDRVHAAMCETETWQWKSGAQAIPIARWLLDSGWKYPPDPRSRDSPKQHRDQPPAALLWGGSETISGAELIRELEGKE